MTGIATLVTSLCAGALLASLLKVLIPETGAGRTVQVAVTAFLLLTVLRGVIGLKETVMSMDFSFGKPETVLPQTDRLVEEQAAAALEEVVKDKLNTAGCAFSSVTARVVYGEKGFTEVSLAVTVEREEEGRLAKEVLTSLNLPVTVDVKGDR